MSRSIETKVARATWCSTVPLTLAECSPSLWSPPDPDAQPLRWRSRNLVVVRAGDHSLHPQWISDGPRDFDLLVSYFGNTPGRFSSGAEHYEMRRGPKWPGIAALLREHKEALEGYDCIWFPDDDLAAETQTINRMFAFFHAYRMCLAQPALSRDSWCTWRTLRQQPNCHVRFTKFVEIMAPIFSREALSVCTPSFSESASGWGLDWLWPRLCMEAGLGDMAVIDATPVRHTRPCGGELYRNNPQLQPQSDASRIVSKYGLNEMRAVAKYSFGKRVQALPLPAFVRFWYSLRRLNARRKHRL
jgi:hypothetical protein